MDICRDFRVCSEELREFLTIFYRSLNDTVVQTFTNYAAMYDRDIVVDEDEEKNGVITTICHAGDLVRERVSKAFVRTTAGIKLDQNKDRKMNIAVLREYVKHTIKAVNKTVSKNIDADIRALKIRLVSIIKQDLRYNLGSDLGNFEADVIKQICSFFITCNGNLAKPSKSQYLLRNKFTASRAKSNRIVVNHDSSLNSNLKRKLMNNHKPIRQDRSEEAVTVRSRYGLNNSNITVTRTTATSKEDNLPTTLINMPLSMEFSDSYENDDESESNTLQLMEK